MSWRERWALVGAGAALLIATATAAETAPPPRQRVVTMTRFVKVFSDLEYQLADALRANDQAVVDRLMAAEFEQRNAARPGEPVPREDWLKSNDYFGPGDGSMYELAVHDRGDLAIASFRWRFKDRDWFLVDVWRKKADSYELVTRYASPLPNVAAAPKAPASQPSGKR